jgi:hypothetical protein
MGSVPHAHRQARSDIDGAVSTPACDCLHDFRFAENLEGEIGVVNRKMGEEASAGSPWISTPTALSVMDSRPVTIDLDHAAGFCRPASGKQLRWEAMAVLEHDGERATVCPGSCVEFFNALPRERGRLLDYHRLVHGKGLKTDGQMGVRGSTDSDHIHSRVPEQIGQ